MKVNEKMQNRLQELVEFAEKVLETRKSGGGKVQREPNFFGVDHYFTPQYDVVDCEMANQWGTSCLYILKKVFGKESDYYIKFNELFPLFKTGESYPAVKNAFGILKAAKDDCKNG